MAANKTRLFTRLIAGTSKSNKNLKFFKQQSKQDSSKFIEASFSKYLLFGGLALGGLALLGKGSEKVQADTVDYDAVRKDIVAILDADGYDDGSYGPVLVRLAWHASGTYSQFDGTGGSDGATMRFEPESAHGANAGLHVARNLLEPIKSKYPGLSYADLWTLAGAVAIEELNGPKIEWRAGRSDSSSSKDCPPDGRLPDAARTEDHVRQIFYRMGFNDREIVALVGAHALGRCHTDRSGFTGPWTRAPTMFSNEYFRELLENTWTEKKWDGPRQFEDPTGDLMMLPADYCLVQDADFKKYVELYRNDEEVFFKDFADAFGRLLELGCDDLKPVPKCRCFTK